jgi:CBS domain-containing protein
MIKVKDIMTTDVITVSPDAEITYAADLLMRHNINGIPVVENDKVIGILCRSDLIAQQKKFPVPSLFSFLDGYIALTSRKHLEKEIQKIAATMVSQAMTRSPVTVQPETPIEEVAALMVDKNFHTLPVVEGGKLVGIVGKEDVLRLLISGPEETY